MYSLSFFVPSLVIDSGVFASLNKTFVALFTPISVAWADNITAINYSIHLNC
jgi:hypothetical protein